jgi:hypothetical protein
MKTDASVAPASGVDSCCVSPLGVVVDCVTMTSLLEDQVVSASTIGPVDARLVVPLVTQLRDLWCRPA